MKQQKSLLDRLTEYNATALPMHMPGHKRNADMLKAPFPYELDITEIDGFDNLHDMNGILGETASLAASLYGSEKAFPLVGGSTCGILAAVHAAVSFGAHVLVARNCHKSVFNAVELLGLHPTYVNPEVDSFGIFGKISPQAVEKALCDDKEIALVIITSPTYEGVVSDAKKIASICHRNNALLLVDSAHGAHLGFSPQLADSAVTSGADLVVMSLHKTMPALTQAALLHVCTDAVSKNKAAESLAIFETSSPSYVLLASIDHCLHMIANDGKRLFGELYKNLLLFREQTKALKALSVVWYDDISKQIVSTKNTSLTGTELADILRKQFRIEVEMAAQDYIIAITGICDSKKSFLQFAEALRNIDSAVPLVPQKAVRKEVNAALPKMIETPFSAAQRPGKLVPIQNAIGYECLEYVWAYPPGIPLIVPGEIIDSTVVDRINKYEQAQIKLKSTKGFNQNKIRATQTCMNTLRE